jgi:hypothetical protein
LALDTADGAFKAARAASSILVSVLTFGTFAVLKPTQRFSSIRVTFAFSSHDHEPFRHQNEHRN